MTNPFADGTVGFMVGILVGYYFSLRTKEGGE